MGKVCNISFYGKEYRKSGTAENLILFYSLKGSTVLNTDKHGELILEEEELVSVNPSEDYSLETENGIAAVIEFRREEVYRLLRGQLRTVDCCSVNVRNGSFGQVRDRIKRLISSMFRDEFSDVAFERNSYELLLILLSEYSVEVHSGDRKAEVSEWIEHSFRDVISLDIAAEHFHLTPQYFSSWFTETFGTSFVKYLASVRCKNARKELVSGNDTILRIALDNGFPNAGSFSHAFVERYGETPLQYRKANQMPDEKTGLKAEDIARYLGQAEDETDVTNEIRIDCTNRSEKLAPYWDTLCNVSDIAGLSDREIQDQIRDLVSSVSFRYARILLGKPKEPFDAGFYTEDKAIEYLLEIGLEAVFVVDYRQCSTEEHFFERFLEFVRHIIHRYGYHTIRVEVLYDTFFDRKKAEGYKAFLAEIKNILERLNVKSRLYGPGLLINRDGSNLQNCLKNNEYIDVVTIRCAPLEVTVEGDMQIKRITDSDYMLHQYALANEIVKGLGLSLKVMITGWKNSLTGYDVLNDSSWAAAHIIRTALKGYGVLPALPLDDPLDIMQADPAKQKLFYGASGLLTVNRLRKPSFYAFQFLAHLDENYLYHNEHFIVTASHGEYFQILMQNCAPLSYRYYLDAQEKKEQIPEDYYETREPYRIRLYLEGVTEGKWFVKTRTINEIDGNVYEKWLSMGYKDLTFWGRDEIKMLEAASFPRMEGNVVESKNGVIEIPVNMEPNEIRHLHLIPIR